MGRRGVVGAVGAVAAVAALGTACSASAGEAPAAAEHATAAKPGLVRYASCARFAADARTRTLRLTGAWGIGAAGPAFDAVTAPATADRAAGGAEGAASAPMREGVDFSGTNVQEAGVDEPDLVETDGRVVYAIADGAVRFTDVSGGAPRALGTPFTPDGATPTGLLLHGDRLVVLAETGGVWGGPAMSRGATIIQSDVMTTVPWTPPRTVLVELDVADPAHATVVTRTTVDGSVVGARRAGDTLRVVLSTATQRIPLTQPASGSRAAERAAARANRRAVLRARAAAWLPRIRVRNAETGVVRTGPAVACTAVSRPTRFAGVGMLTVLTMDVPNGLRVLDSDAVMSDGDLVYASATGLYIATPRWYDPAAATADAPPRGSTLIHKLDTADPARTTYRASGVVLGMAARPVLDVRARRPPPGGQHGGARLVVGRGRAGVREPRDRAGGAGRQARPRGPGDRPRQGRAHPGRAVHRRPRLRRHLPPGGPALRRGPRRPRPPRRARRAEDPRLLVLPAPGRRRPAGRHRPVRDRPGAHHGHPGLAVRRVRPGARRGGSPSASSTPTGRRPSRTTTRCMWWPARRLLVVPVERWSGVGPAALGAVGLDVAPATGITPIARIRHPGDEDAYRPVRRSLVAGDALVTVSDGGVLVSDLASLAPRGWLAFG